MRGSCQLCGECLSRCIYLRLTKDEARVEMRRVDEGRPAPHIDAKCVSCAACNVFCPHGAEPYDRILARWHARYLRHGLPARARYLMPTEQKSFRTDVLAKLPADERTLVERWAHTRPAGDVLYPGCNFITCAYLAKSGLFRDLTIAGGLDQCCGEMYYRLGMPEIAERMAHAAAEYYGGGDVERMIFVCPACFNMFAHEMKRLFNVSFAFEKVFIVDYLLDLMRRGRLEIKRPLNRTVVMHDSCHGRLLGPDFMDRVRELLHHLGARTVEARYAREEGFCCGIAAAAPRQSPLDPLHVARWAHREYRRSGAQAVATYCTGCYLTLGMLRPFALGLPVTHLLELVAEAVGHPVPDRFGSRTRSMLLGIVTNAVPQLVSRKRFWVK